MHVPSSHANDTTVARLMFTAVAIRIYLTSQREKGDEQICCQEVAGPMNSFNS